MKTLTNSKKCYICSNNLEIKYNSLQEFELNKFFSVYTCPDCGLGMTLPVPEDLSLYYSDSYYEGRHGITSTFCCSRRIKVVQRVVNLGVGSSILDFGCGDGSFIKTASKLGWDAWGLERERPFASTNNLKVFNCLSEIDNTQLFDCITLWHVLEHLEDPIRVLRSLRKRLKPQGRLIMAVPNFASLQSETTKTFWLHLDIPRHLFHYTDNSLDKILRKSYCKLDKILYGELEYDVIGWSQSLINQKLGGNNIFLKAMMGRKSREFAITRAFHTSAGLILSSFMIFVAYLEWRLGRGGTIIVVARPAEMRSNTSV